MESLPGSLHVDEDLSPNSPRQAAPKNPRDAHLKPQEKLARTLGKANPVVFRALASVRRPGRMEGTHHPVGKRNPLVPSPRAASAAEAVASWLLPRHTPRSGA